jgi:hypothetical protein
MRIVARFYIVIAQYVNWFLSHTGNNTKGMISTICKYSTSYTHMRHGHADGMFEFWWCAVQINGTEFVYQADVIAKLRVTELEYITGPNYRFSKIFFFYKLFNDSVTVALLKTVWFRFPCSVMVDNAAETRQLALYAFLSTNVSSTAFPVEVRVSDVLAMVRSWSSLS